METKKILKWPLIIGIVIVLNLFFLYAVKVAYPEPRYNNYCEDKPVVKQINNQEECLIEGGQWVEQPQYEVRMIGVSDPLVEDELPATSQRESGYCNQQFTCHEEFNTAREDYERNVFIALIIFGVISVIIGFMTLAKEVVSIALSLSGILSFIIASLRYWQYASDWLHLAILGLALVVLIYLAIKKFTE
ncbi:MAG: hypothetical protein KAS02_01220 [Candidatus Pacebacteria bacterium]|nr:hypothetical protein [Candidatus Paceibacterota bacterium]